MSKRILLSLIILLWSFWGVAQTHELAFGGGLTLESLRDKGYSPLLYSGAGISGFIGYERNTDRRETIWMFSYGRASTSNSFDRQLTTSSVGLVNYNFYNRDTESPVKWGWSNNNAFNNRNIDGFSNFNGRTNFFTSFGPAMKYERGFSLKEQNFTFQIISHVQLIGFYMPSGYVSSYPRGFTYEPNTPLAGFWESLYLFYPGSAWNAGLWPKVQWHLSSGNSICLNYMYEYSRLRGAHVSERSAGTWFLTFFMQLK